MAAMGKFVAEPVIVFQPDGIEIPARITSLARFRRWALSESFPERGRIDWVAGRLEVDMSPEDLFTHGTPKAAIVAALVTLLQPKRRGLVFTDRTRVSCPDADLSAEPDVLVILLSTLRRGKVRLVRKTSKKKGRYVEIEGAPDLVVECVSDSSAAKDKKDLPELYHRAGVQEYWIVDARGDDVDLQVLHYRPKGYVRARSDASGFVRSIVLKRDVRLVREVVDPDIVFFELEVREA